MAACIHWTEASKVTSAPTWRRAALRPTRKFRPARIGKASNVAAEQGSLHGRSGRRGWACGHGRTSDGRLDVELLVPEDMGGEGGPGTNPEQLFASGYAACFESAMRAVARKQKRPLTDASVTGHVSFNVVDEGKYVLSVELHGKVEGLSREDAEALMHAAHEVCPYSNATRGNIDVKLVVD